MCVSQKRCAFSIAGGGRFVVAQFCGLLEETPAKTPNATRLIAHCVNPDNVGNIKKSGISDTQYVYASTTWCHEPHHRSASEKLNGRVTSVNYRHIEANVSRNVSKMPTATQLSAHTPLRPHALVPVVYNVLPFAYVRVSVIFPNINSQICFCAWCALLASRDIGKCCPRPLASHFGKRKPAKGLFLLGDVQQTFCTANRSYCAANRLPK